MEKQFHTSKEAMIRYGWKSKSKFNQIILYKPGYSAQFIIEKQNWNNIIRITAPIPNSNYNYTTLLSIEALNKYLLQHLENYENKTK